MQAFTGSINLIVVDNVSKVTTVEDLGDLTYDSVVYVANAQVAPWPGMPIVPGIAGAPDLPTVIGGDDFARVSYVTGSEWPE